MPGTLLAGRYRIVGPIGRGGMGRVYRADDLKLGQAVAMKFLPDSLARDAAALARFHGEVRVARQVSHPGICRVFDIAEVAGEHFLTMEYIDGEDLASLIRRIGRLPWDKALELARQICSGLAAAHDLGVLHRDLKPANIMIDGRGRARIADFGLAGLAGEIHGADIASGTPAYMAPEQLAGHDVTVRSDLYSLGLVLYEMFTGQHAFEVGSDPRRDRDASGTVTPSTVVRDFDPLVEKVIQRCLETDPTLRPSSAMQVAAALPGGDPLAAALAAGETPSPEMVAAAPAEGALSPRAVGGLLAIIVLLVTAIAIGDRVNLFSRVPHEKSPAALADRASTLLALLGWNERPVGTAWGVTRDEGFFNWEGDAVPAPQRMRRVEKGQPLAYYFWYRQAPIMLAPYGSGNGATRVTLFDPPQDVESMATVTSDLTGRLVSLEVVPPAIADSVDDAREPDWAPLFAAAGLDLARFTPTAPTWTPPFAFDRAAGWRGAFADHPDLPLDVVAASYRGRPVYFRLIAPWDSPAHARPAATPATQLAATLIGALLLGGVMLAAALLARRNLRAGSGDRSGAARLAGLAFALAALGRAIGSQTAAGLDGLMARTLGAASSGLLTAATLWVCYIALEPYVRRHRPRLIVSWARLVGGAYRDPLIGRDALIGATLGFAATGVWTLSGWLKEWFALPYSPNRAVDDLAVGGVSAAIAFVLSGAAGALWGAFVILIFIALLRPVVRGEMRAALVLWMLITTVWVLTSTRSWPAVSFALVSTAITIFAAARFGLVASVVQLFVFYVTLRVPVATDLSAWYAPAPVTALLAVGAIVTYAAWVAPGPRPGAVRLARRS